MKLNKEVKVGLLAILAFTVVYLGINFLKGKTIFSSNNSYYTVYANSKGLHISSPVLLNGVPVGKVIKLQTLPNEGHAVLVNFETERDIKLTNTTTAHLVSSSLFGEKAIDLRIGKGDLLKNNDTIPGQIQESFQEGLFAGTVPALRDIQNISFLVNQFIANLIENTDKINSIFINLEESTQRLKKTVNNSQPNIHILSQNMVEVSNALSDSNIGIRPFLKSINQFMAGIKGKEMQELTMKLNHILSSVGRIFNKIEKENTSFSQLIENDGFYNNLNRVLESLDQLLVDFKAYPERYVSFSVFGKKQVQEPPQ